MTHPTHGLDPNALEALRNELEGEYGEKVIGKQTLYWLVTACLAALSQNPGTSNTPGEAEPVAWRWRPVGVQFGDIWSVGSSPPNERSGWTIEPLYTIAALEPPASDRGAGIYIASKTKHAARWRSLRDSGVPINSTWIDEAGEGESQDLQDLWRRCLSEASSASAIIVYREPDDVLKGGWIELGAAASHGVPVFAVGIEQFTIARHKGIQHFDNFDDALAAAIRKLSEVSHEH